MVTGDTTPLPLEPMEQAGCIFVGLDESGCVNWINAFDRRLLGLPSVEKIARQHGGEVKIKSRPGEGTTAIVSIPRLPEREA